MKHYLLLAGMGLLLASPAAQAEPIPAYVLDKDFQGCMGGEDPATSPQRAVYCTCIRDKMKTWDLDTYGNVATEQAQVGVARPTQSISELAKECMAQALK